MALNYFTFGPYDSRDFGIYISGSGTFNAPEAEYETAIVPGRNGALLLPEHRLGNVELEYPAYIYTDFNAKIAAMRSAFLGLEGYQRLTDSYHPDEYRLAYFPGDVEVKTTKKLDAGSFTLTFVCKPQRYLVDGEQPVEIGTTWGELTTKTGALVTFDGKAGDAYKSLVVDIEPVQSGTGDPSPSNVRSITGHDSVNVTRTGKNMLHNSLSTTTKQGLTYTVNSDGSVTVTGTATANSYVAIPINRTFDENVILSGAPSITGIYGQVSTSGGNVNDTGSGATITAGTTITEYRCRINNGVNPNGATFYPMMRLASDTDATFEQYTGTTYPVSFSSAGTVYGGTVDVVSGELTVTDANIASYAGETLPSTWISDRDVYAAETTPTTGAQVVYKLATPQTYQLTPAEITTLLGTNNVWADTGDVTLQYGTSPFAMVNPTQQTARPLIRVYGYGTLVVGDCTVTIASHAYTYIDIDCDIMDCHYGTTNCNSLVSFSTHEFPTFPPGVTWISFNNTITKVEVEPDWWRA